MIKFPRKDLEVFDFKEEDEIASENYLTNKNPILDHQSLSCHDAQVDKVGVKNVASIPCVDVDIVGGNFNLEKGGSDPSLDTGGDIFESKEKNSELEAANQLNSISQEYLCHFKTDIHNYNEPEKRDTSDGVSSPETSQVDPSGSPSINESVDVNSDADDCMNESAPTSPGSDIADNVSLNGCGFDGIDNSNMDGSNTDVILHPDYVIYQDNYCMEPKLTFSRCCIKLNFSTACKKQGAIDLEWEVDDVIDIKCQQFQNSATVIIKLRVISSNASQSKHVSDTSGIEELEIAVVDSNWSLRHKQITSLNMKYLAIWNVVLHTDLEGNGNDSHGSRCYFPNFEEPFDEVIYPKGDPDAVSLGKRDVDLLQPDTFINDTIIDFYIQYLKNQIQEEEKPRFHFFNSFFFRKLADMDKNPSSASDGKAAFLRVRKWTRKVNLFEKDYIFIPVNFNLHWSLIVICHPGEVVNFNDKQLDKSLKVPCILHMDSIKGSHSGLKNLVQRELDIDPFPSDIDSYLCEEWKERHKDALEEDLSSEFLNMRFLPLALPQQENSYDCGLFLLHYLELFLAEAPFSFNPCKITKSSNFLNVNWFLPAEAYLKRTLIQRLIFELVENHGSHENSSDECSDDQTYLENNENRTGIECAEINMESTTSNAEQGIEITLLSGSSSLNPQSYNNSGLVPKELLEPGATTTRTLLGQCQSFDQRSSDFRFNGSTIFSMEEDTDFMYLATVPNLQQVAGITPQTCSLPYLPRDCGDETCLGPEISLQVEHEMPEISLQMEHDMADASLVASSDASDDSEDIGIIENCPIGNNEPRSSNEAERDEKISSPTENPEHLVYVSGSDDSNLPNTCVMGISRESITKCDGNKNGDLHSSCHETRTVPLLQISDAVDENATCNDGQMLDDVAPDICEEQVAKRRRLMPLQCRSEGIVTESNL